ncbi:carboxypeptidase regulatory-like domain-containing protein [Chitinophaga lutea]|uniref:Carboxypeptidase regulatory-like domain-containing protein n=1 Tax=Chitinophaga lutea TaxID=2488634 RepID=A0A3N4PXR3_9BACT|nr:carboxypeptidase-like regulatory domain-containing protein [Chitinophaga lutea]RPE13613.1 carboxypeptidase regulatory-like domain-containing protein [Chitinophaga lutea]
MNPFLILLLLVSTAAAAQQTDTAKSRSIYLVNGLPADSADLRGLKIRKMDVIGGQRAMAAGMLPGVRVIVIQLEEQEFDVSGLVTDQQGKPLRKVKAASSGGGYRKANIDNHGRFYIQGVKAGTRLSFTRKGYQTGKLDVFKQPDSLITVKLQRN